MADLNSIVEQLSALTVLEAADLAKMLEEKWGVSAAAAVAVAAGPAAAAAPAAEEPVAEEPAAEEPAAPAASSGGGKSLKDQIKSVAEQVAYCRKVDTK